MLTLHDRMSSSNSYSTGYALKCSCGEMICLTSRTSSNPNRKFWRCPNWKDGKGCGRFIWKDEVDNGKNLVNLIEDLRNTMEKQNEILWAVVEELKYAYEVKKKSNKFHSMLVFFYALISLICIMKTFY